MGNRNVKGNKLAIFQLQNKIDLSNYDDSFWIDIINDYKNVS